VTADLEWYNRRIDDADVAGAVDRKIGVDHASHFARHHSSCSDVVEVGAICNVKSVLNTAFSTLVKVGLTCRFQPLLPIRIRRIGWHGSQPRSDLVRECVGEGRCVSELSRHFGGRDLLVDVVVQHEVVGVDVGRRRSVGRVDVDAATREGKEAPVFNRDGPRCCWRDNDFRNGDLVLEDEVILHAKQLFGHSAVNDATGVGRPLSVVFDRLRDARVEGSEAVPEYVVYVEVGSKPSKPCKVGAVVVDVEHIRGGLVLQVLANKW
jgi:hypothetical protein